MRSVGKPSQNYYTPIDAGEKRYIGYKHVTVSLWYQSYGAGHSMASQRIADNYTNIYIHINLDRKTEDKDCLAACQPIKLLVDIMMP